MKLESTRGLRNKKENTTRNLEIRNVKCKQNEKVRKRQVTVVMAKFYVSDCGGGYTHSHL